jgi:hypothetical protein
VSLSESKPVIISFLRKLPGMFAHSIQTQSAFGAALKAAEKLIVLLL